MFHHFTGMYIYYNIIIHYDSFLYMEYTLSYICILLFPLFHYLQVNLNKILIQHFKVIFSRCVYEKYDYYINMHFLFSFVVYVEFHIKVKHWMMDIEVFTFIIKKITIIILLKYSLILIMIDNSTIGCMINFINEDITK